MGDVSAPANPADSPAIDRLRRLVGFADALSRALADLLADLDVDDVRGRARAGYLSELLADVSADLWTCCAAVIGELERADRAAPWPRPEPDPT